MKNGIQFVAVAGMLALAGAIVGMALLRQGYAGQAWGDLPPDKAKAIDALIKQLGAKEFEARETATKKLIEMGPNVLAAVKKTLAETIDPEVKARCERVIADMRLVEKKVKSLGKVPVGVKMVWPNLDGTRIAFIRAGNRNMWSVWCDGKGSDEYEDVSGVNFSKDGRHLAYARKGGRSWRVVKDGEEGPEWEEAYFPALSSDGSRMAYWAKKEGKWRVVVNGESGPPFLEMRHQVRLSEDGKHLAYSGRRQEGCVVVMDGKEGPVYEDVGWLSLSADGQRLAYAGKGEGGWVAVVDGKVEGGCAGAMFNAFSPDSKRLAWALNAGGQGYVVEDGKRGTEYAQVRELTFSPNSEKLAHAALAMTGGDLRFKIVVDGKELPATGMVEEVQFSPDSRHVGCLAMSADHKGYHLMCDGMVGKEYAEYYRQWGFSKDNRHIFRAVGADGESMMVLDGLEGPAHRIVRVPLGGADDPGKLRYVVVDGEEAWLVEVEWPEGIDWTNGMRPLDSGK